MEIKTWVERCNDHPDHQTGMISHSMIQARMQEEIEDLRDEVERLTEALGVSISNHDNASLEIERQQAEIERLQADHDALRGAAREYLKTLGGALKSGKFEMGGTAEMAHFVRQAMQKLDSLVFDRAGPRPAGLEKLHEPHGRAS